MSGWIDTVKRAEIHRDELLVDGMKEEAAKDEQTNNQTHKQTSRKG